MSVLSNYLTGRYIDRLDELVADVIVRKRSTESEESFREFLINRMHQFNQITKMHITGFERQDVPTDNADMKYIPFMDQRWIIGLLCGDVTTDAIKEA